MSIWFTEAFIGAILCKIGRWMGALGEEGGDGGCGGQEGCVFRCSKVHAILSDLSFYRSDTKLGPAGKFAIDIVADAPGAAACSFRALARCNRRLDDYDPVLLTFNVGLGEVAKIYLK